MTLALLAGVCFLDEFFL